MWAQTIWFLIILNAATKKIDAGQPCLPKCRPVMFLPGLLAPDRSMDVIAYRIKKDYPGTVILNSTPVLKSLAPLWKQIDGQVGQEFLAYNAMHPGGITLIGHSQGGLFARSLCEVYSNHSVHTLITLAGPLLGVYGALLAPIPLLHLLAIPPVLRLITAEMYLPISQNLFSFATYWNDPEQHEAYLKKNHFLPFINNEVPSNRSQSFKEGFTKLKKHVTVTGPDDGALFPWQTGEYSYYGNAYPAAVPCQDSEIYQKDLFGLRTLNESGRWIRYVKSGVNHYDWIFNEQVYNEAILPYLGCTHTPSDC